jgi:hypothetical protein
MDCDEKVGTSTGFDSLAFTPASQRLHGARIEQVPPMFKVSEHIDVRATNRYAELLQISKVVASHRNLNELFQDLARHMHAMVDFHFLSVVLHDPLRAAMRMHVLEADGLGELHPGMEFPVDESPSGWSGRPSSHCLCLISNRNGGLSGLWESYAATACNPFAVSL